MNTMALRTRLLLLIPVMAMSILCSGARSKHSVPQRPASSSINISSTIAAGGKRSITLDDMLSLREVHEPRQSPDRRHVAFLVKQAFLKCDCYRTALYLTSAQEGAAAEKLAEADYMSNLQWTPDGRSISYLSSRGGTAQLWKVDVTTRRAISVFVHTANRDLSTDRAFVQSVYLPASGVLDYRWSPDGNMIAFTTETPADPSNAASAARNGFRYDDEKMIALDLVTGDWGSSQRSKQLWLYDTRRGRQIFLWTSPAGWYTNISSLLWTDGGKRLIFSYSMNEGDGSDAIAVIDVASSSVSQVGSAGGRIQSAYPIWSPNAHEMVYIARLPTLPVHALFAMDVNSGTRRELARDIYGGHFPWVAWDADRHRILFLSEGLGKDRRQTGIYSVPENGGESQRLTDLASKVDECGIMIAGTTPCVWQTPSIAPRPALVSTTDSSIVKLIDVNPEMAGVELAPVREIHWQNSEGNETNGFLILPTHATPGERVPLVVVGYAFSGEFVTQANPILTTYPAQAFARDGVAVLLFNYPRYDGWKGPSFELGSRAIGYGPLSSIQSIVKQLDVDGLIDPKRVGMMGHSLSGFWVQLAITHTNLFKAVEMHNGGTASEPGTYWINGSKSGREDQEHVMGGPPYGATLNNYLGFSMSLNAGRIRSPVLMEYNALEALSAMEYYEAMQHYGVPVDFYITPNDGHRTERPQHRLLSMQRNLDWFEFWLLGQENEASSKSEQYTRWRAMKTRLAGVAGSRAAESF